MVENTNSARDLFFDPDPWPKLPAAEYFFFLFVDENCKASCTVVHRALRPGMYIKGKSEVFTWTYPEPYVFKGVCVTKFVNNTFEAVGDVSIKFTKMGEWYQVKGDRVGTGAGGKREGNFVYAINPGELQKTFKYGTISLAKIFEGGAKFIHNFDSGSNGFMYQMFGNYKSDNSKGKFYIERLRLNTLNPEFLVWKLYDVLFDDGSILSASATPASQQANGIFVDRADNTYRALKPKPKIDRVVNNNTLTALDTAGNEINVVGVECAPVYQTDFKRGPVGMNLQQSVGKLESITIGGKKLDKSGVVYTESTNIYLGW